MKLSSLWLHLCAAFLFSTLSAIAQSPQDAEITLFHPSVGSLKADLKMVLELATPEEQKQWEDIEGFIDTFATGLDDFRPVIVRHLTGVKPNASVIWAPINDSQPFFKELRDNFESLGYELARDTKDRSLYKLSAPETGEYGWLIIHADIKYISFVITLDEAASPGLKAILLAQTFPTLKTDASIAAEVVNGDASDAAQKHRREAFGETRSLFMDKIKKRPDESTSRFDLRKLATEQTMEEGERLLAETAKLALSMKLDVKDAAHPVARIQVAFTSIAGTQLQSAMDQFGAQPDPFASMKKADGSALSFRVNHPLDPLRIENFVEFIGAAEKEVASRINASTAKSANQKAAANKLSTGVMNIARETVKSGWINGFVEGVPTGNGDFTIVSAFSAPTGSELNTLLPELANAGKGNVVEMNVAKQGEVAIHRIQLAEGFVDVFDEIWGIQKDVFIGVGPTHVWLGSGPGALEAMKKAVASLGTPAPNSSPLSLEMKMLPWVKRWDEIAKKDPPGKTPEAQEKQRSDARIRARAIAAMTEGDDLLSVNFTHADNELNGVVTADTGLIRFFAKMMAAFSKENFQ
jgi:hypothetical protein